MSVVTRMTFSGPPRDQLAISQIRSKITEFIQQRIFEICVVLVLLILDLRDLTEKGFLFYLASRCPRRQFTYTGNRFEFSGPSSADAWVTMTDVHVHDI
jgi:hypothetical protein